MGLTEEDISQYNPLLKRAFSLDNASVKEFHQARMIEIRKT